MSSTIVACKNPERTNAKSMKGLKLYIACVSRAIQYDTIIMGVGVGEGCVGVGWGWGEGGGERKKMFRNCIIYCV